MPTIEITKQPAVDPQLDDVLLLIRQGELGPVVYQLKVQDLFGSPAYVEWFQKLPTDPPVDGGFWNNGWILAFNPPGGIS